MKKNNSFSIHVLIILKQKYLITFVSAAALAIAAYRFVNRLHSMTNQDDYLKLYSKYYLYHSNSMHLCMQTLSLMPEVTASNR